MRLGCPGFTDKFIGRQTLEGLESFGDVVGHDEVNQVDTQLIVTSIAIASDGRLLDGPVHPFYLAVGPRMVGLCQAMFDTMKLTSPVEGMAAQHGGGALAVLRQVGELDAVIGEHGMDRIGHSLDQGVEKSRGDLGVGSFGKLDEGKLRGPVDGDEQMELAFLGAHFGDIDVEITDGV